VRVALVSPYSWTYPGGVNGHVAALARELRRVGDDVRILAPWDPPDRLGRLLHGGPATALSPPEGLIPLGRTIAFPANGAVSNLSAWPAGVLKLRRELRSGRFDVIHVHEPIAPLIGWFLPFVQDTPLVGTFHSYSTQALPNRIATVLGGSLVLNRLQARIAVSEAAAWTGRRWFGGRYRTIPNGVDLSLAPRGPKPESEALRIVFLGRSDERKGLPVLLAAFAALVRHVPAQLTVIGPEPADVMEYLADPEAAANVKAVGRLPDGELWRSLHAADLLCAPSLSGESFGMVLTEAFAAGTPVVASAIAGYSEIVDDGRNGLLVPPGDAQRLGETLRELALDRDRLAAMSRAARATAERYAWPRVAGEVRDVYQQALDAARATGRRRQFARRIGLAPADGLPLVPPQRLPGLDPVPARRAQRSRRLGRKLSAGAASIIGLGLAALALHHLGLHRVTAGIARSNPSWVAVSLVLMAAAMLLRAVSWQAILTAALPGRRVRFLAVASATMIGVLVSTAFPGRLGEPARAMVVARRLGRVQDTLPVLIGSLISQVLLNLLALVGLAVIVLLTSRLLQDAPLAPAALLLVAGALVVAVLVAPRLLAGRHVGRLGRALVGLRRVLLSVRAGLSVFRQPGRALEATTAQLAAWAVQVASAYAIIRALGLDDRVGVAAAAAALLAVNVTAVVPVTPANVGVFQAAVAAVLTAGYGLSAASALEYGIVLQAVEVVTAVALGAPAMLREGLTWSDIRLQALRAVELTPRDDSVNAPRAG
jgi:phosphatidyl-myo-inositol alpha-mannosyltransferase